MEATASSQTGSSGWAPAPELFPSGARAAATSPPAFVNKPHPFFNCYQIPFLLNLTHTTLDLITAIVLANIYHAPVYMGAAYWIPAFWVPSLLVTHHLVFRVLAGERRGRYATGIGNPPGTRGIA